MSGHRRSVVRSTKSAAQYEVAVVGDALVESLDLGRMIHDHFNCTRRYAAYDEPGCGLSASRRAGSPLGPSTYCFKYASASRDSACPSRQASPRFRYELA